jgi:hypothetical protein
LAYEYFLSLHQQIPLCRCEEVLVLPDEATFCY